MLGCHSCSSNSVCTGCMNGESLVDGKCTVGANNVCKNNEI